jgi:hypothetical protein
MPSQQFLKWCFVICAAFWVIGGILFGRMDNVMGLPPRTLFVQIFGSATLVIGMILFLRWWSARKPRNPEP